MRPRPQEDVVRPTGMEVGGYRIEKKLGAGGFGKVFLAWRDGSPCALKFLHLERVGEWGWRELFIMLRHQFPHVVKLLSHFRWREEGAEYLVLVMEYVPGVTLYQWARDNNPCAREVVEKLLPPERGRLKAALQGLRNRRPRINRLLVDGHFPLWKCALDGERGPGTYTLSRGRKREGA